MQYKIRYIVNSKKFKIKGVTIPEDIAVFYNPDTKFSIQRFTGSQLIVGNFIVLMSGLDLKPTKDQIEKYKFEDSIIN